jgi:hypothetical protein
MRNYKHDSYSLMSDPKAILRTVQHPCQPVCQPSFPERRRPYETAFETLRQRPVKLYSPNRPTLGRAHIDLRVQDVVAVGSNGLA